MPMKNTIQHICNYILVLFLLQATILFAQKPNTGGSNTTTAPLGAYNSTLGTATSSSQQIDKQRLTTIDGDHPTNTTQTGGHTGHQGSGTILSTCPLMYVQVDILYLQSCVSSPTRIGYCNHGTGVASNVYVEVQLDSIMTLDSAAISYTSLGNNKYRFDLGTVVDSSCGGFDIYTTTDCDSTLIGQSHCIAAKIYPDTICADVWNHYVLTSDAICFGDSILFELKNHGTTISTTSQIEYIIIDDHLLINGQGTILKRGVIALASGASKFVSLDNITAGGQYRLEILDANEDLISSTSVSNCQTSNTSNAIIYNNTAQQFWNGSSVPSMDQGCSVNGVLPSASMAGGSASTQTNNSTATNNRTEIVPVEQDITSQVTAVNAFPNPFRQFTTIALEGDISTLETLDLYLYDIAGRQVAHEQTTEQTTIELQRGNLQAGVYFFRIEANKKLVGTGKLVVQ